MVIYADVLIITNLVIDYFLLLATAKIIKREPPLWRMILSAILASLTSLLIFLPEQSKTAEFLLKFFPSFIICLACFGYINLRRWVYTSLTFFAVAFAYAGAMIAIWYIFKPYGMAINNSVVYFNVSPLFLILFSVVGFLIFTVVSSLIAKRTAKKCIVKLCFCGKEATFSGIIDSGNSLTDVFTDRAVIITDRKKAINVFGELNSQIYAERYRAVPCSTVSSDVLLDGFRCEKGKIIIDKKTVKLIKPIMALSQTELCDCEAIVNPADCDLEE